MKIHNYFKDSNANNEINAIRAACWTMNEHNLWLFAQRALITATEAQSIMKERFPTLWKEFDANAMQEK